MLDRLREIYRRYGEHLYRIVPLSIEEDFLKCILYLDDGTNLRAVEEWREGRLIRYSYYWLTSANDLIIGWDNAPHHPEIPSYPHHKHVGSPIRREPALERGLEEVLDYILAHPHTSTRSPDL
ncbi:MAG: toxin-antitoxin system TumE family protein [Chloroflexia bacterium]